MFCGKFCSFSFHVHFHFVLVANSKYSKCSSQWSRISSLFFLKRCHQCLEGDAAHPSVVSYRLEKVHHVMIVSKSLNLFSFVSTALALFSLISHCVFAFNCLYSSHFFRKIFFSFSQRDHRCSRHFYRASCQAVAFCIEHF